ATAPQEKAKGKEKATAKGKEKAVDKGKENEVPEVTKAPAVVSTPVVERGRRKAVESATTKAADKAVPVEKAQRATRGRNAAVNVVPS
ncbi:hypothetical protein Q0P64_13770, partial [Staphylococcus aureus]|nr:hypothetical protein [Staphylococcus aureus]